MVYRVSGDMNAFDPKEGTVIPPINQKLVDSALNAFFEEQNPNGMWDKGKFKFDKIELCSIKLLSFPTKSFFFTFFIYRTTNLSSFSSYRS